VVYLDTSVVLAHLRAEDVTPPPGLWEEPLVASRLLEYELTARLHAHGRAASHGEAARDLLARVAMLEMVEPVLARAKEPFPTPLRTLDALHLASMLFLVDQGVRPRIASYDRRLRSAAESVGIEPYPL
jgi:predicted nucleic acid-binding protein